MTGAKAKGGMTINDVVELLTDETLPLRSFLRISDMFMLRRTCKFAWGALSHRTLTKGNALQVALSAVHIPMVKWCLEVGALVRPGQWEAFGATGDMSVIDACVEGKGEEVRVEVLAGAARAGHGDIVLALLERMTPEEREEATDDVLREAIADGGLLHVAQTLGGDRAAWRGLPVSSALIRGHGDFARWAMEGAAPGDRDNCLSYAAGTGSLELVEWFASRGWPVTDAAMDSAARAGSIDMLNWVASHGVMPSPDSMAHCAEGGHIRAIEWFGGMGLPLTEDAVTVAAMYQTVELVDWLLAQGCPFDSFELTTAACRNPTHAVELLVYLADRRMAFEADKCMAALASGPCADIPIVHRRLNLPLPNSLLYHAVRTSNLDLLRFGLDHDVPLSSSVIGYMIGNEEVAMLHEVLDAATVDGVLTGETRALVEEAVRAEAQPSPAVAEVLSRYIKVQT